ncbi:MAG: ABC transporter ATP-binding protein [Clostridia bacterium]|nr:ABC transporter ATP-binding protein [Clostridia bacterium]
MLEIRNLSAGYSSVPVLHDISLSIPSGKITVIVGPNGCGKSTLLKALVGIIPCMSGEVLLGGEHLHRLTTQEQAKRIAYLPQDRRIPDTTVMRLVLHGRFPYLGYPRRYRHEDVQTALSALRRMGIDTLAEQPLNTLSGGMRQKAYIAMALAQAAPVILMDEPNAFLDISHQLQLSNQVRELAEDGKTVILVLHDLAMALKLADHLVVIKDGRVLHHGSPDEALRSGSLSGAFNVKIHPIQTPDGRQYYFTPLERN